MFGSFLKRLLYRLYDSLTVNDSIKPVDLIFVLAGRMERKPYGLELYRSGIAPRLLLSVGRFEVSRMGMVDRAMAAELSEQRDRTAPEDRHFFCDISAHGTSIRTVKLRRWNTYGELLGLREFLREEVTRSVMVVSTDVHLRRVSAAWKRVFRNSPLEPRYCAVPSRISSLQRDEWWTRSRERRFVLKEATKLAAYRLVLRAPDWLIAGVMRLKD